MEKGPDTVLNGSFDHVLDLSQQPFSFCKARLIVLQFFKDGIQRPEMMAEELKANVHLVHKYWIIQELLHLLPLLFMLVQEAHEAIPVSRHENHSVD